MFKKRKLDTREARTDLTSRECAKVLGGTIGALRGMASEQDVRNAVRWWAETDEAWEGFATMAATMRRATREHLDTAP